MKSPKIRINGVYLGQVHTRQIVDYPTSSVTSIGLPRHSAVVDGDQMTLTMHPLTATQLYFDGVLPTDRAVTVEIAIGTKRAAQWRVVSLCTQKNRHSEQLVVFTLEKV